MLTDEALMLAFQRGSRQAFEELFDRYRQALYGFFRRRLDNRERAEDLAQETFLAVIRADGPAPGGEPVLSCPLRLEALAVQGRSEPLHHGDPLKMSGENRNNWSGRRTPWAPGLLP